MRWDNENVHLNGIPVWEASSGEITMSEQEFLESVTSFDTRFLAAMQERTSAVCANWTRPEVKINLEELEREQQKRSHWLAAALRNYQREFSWEQVHSALTQIEANL